VPKRVEPRPKPLPPPKPARIKKPAPDIMHETATGPRDSSTTGDGMDSSPGPRLPLRDETRETAAGNVLGPPSAHTTEGRLVGPIEG
jgi:hypothetical protein